MAVTFQCSQREAQKRFSREPQKRKPQNCEMHKAWVNLTKPCFSQPVLAQAFAVDSSNAESALGESGVLERRLGPSEHDAVDPRELPPLKGQYGTA